MHVTYKVHINELFMLSVELPVNSRLLVVKFSGTQKLQMGFWLCVGSVSLTPVLFKGQLHILSQVFMYM